MSFRGFQQRSAVRVSIVFLVTLVVWQHHSAHAQDLQINVHPVDVLLVTSFEQEDSLQLIAVSGGRVSREQEHATDGRYALRVDLDANPDGWPNIQFRLGDGKLPADWSSYVGLMFDVHIAAGPIKSYVVRIDADHDGQIAKAIHLLFPTGEPLHDFVLRFDRPKGAEAEALRLLTGIAGVALPPMQQANIPDREKITVFQIYVSRPDEKCDLYIDNVRLVRRYETDVPTTNIVDPFGQLALLDWPRKIHSVDDMLAYDREEQQWFETAHRLKNSATPTAG